MFSLPGKQYCIQDNPSLDKLFFFIGISSMTAIISKQVFKYVFQKDSADTIQSLS